MERKRQQSGKEYPELCNNKRETKGGSGGRIACISRNAVVRDYRCVEVELPERRSEAIASGRLGSVERLVAVQQEAVELFADAG